MLPMWLASTQLAAGPVGSPLTHFLVSGLVADILNPDGKFPLSVVPGPPAL